MACSGRRLVKSGCWGGQKWAFPVPVLDKHSLLSFLLCSFLQWFSVCCPIPLLSVTWLLWPVTPSTPYVGRAESATRCSPGQRHRKGWWLHKGGRQEPADSLPQSASCRVLHIVCYPHSEQLESNPFGLSASLSAASQLSVCPSPASSSPTLPIALCLHRKVMGPANIYCKFFLL